MDRVPEFGTSCAPQNDRPEVGGAIAPRHRALVLTAGLGGLRQGELFALRWSDVDLSDAVIHVRRKRLRLASGEVIEDDPKSRAGKRVVALPAVLVDELVAHRSAFSTGRPDSYVFTSPSGVPLDRTNFRQREWALATEAVGLAGFRFHDLRHTAGTLAAQTGASTKELMARLGHSSARAAPGPVESIPRGAPARAAPGTGLDCPLTGRACTSPPERSSGGAVGSHR